MRIADAQTTLEHIGDEAGDVNRRQKTALAEKKLCTMKPFTAVAFNGLYTRLKRKALEAQPARNADHAVTPLESLRRGQRPIDSFSVMCDELVSEILGERELVIQPNGTATKLVPPLDFFLRAQRDGGTGELRRVCQLTVKGHYVALVRDHGAPGAPIFRTDHAGFDYPPDDVCAYQRATARALLARAARGEAVSAEFLQWAHAQ